MPVVDLIRHGEPDINVHDDFQRPLTAHGQVQAQRLTKLLASVPYMAVFSSPLIRAIRTVQPVALAHGLKAQTSNLLVERKMPVWFEDGQEFTDYVERQWSDFTFAKNGGESLKQAQTRYVQFISRLDETAVAAVGSHGTVMSTIYELVHPGMGFVFWQRLPYAAVLRVKLKHGAFIRAELL
ncbi:histidine phosphatase family protein [Lactobacillus sp. ESL0791]|uniref:histidine phosphatase family protein n=1 Tax=Lactobacillus sp. ESL0791 TaxID=2983234 RepID=UPI0023F9308B|nr:histidine phosphatase family protein [Lactobacillus sp. ESL0791]MDF7639375.1 histidine phosphatase family protein [Lactobacillus sp. ESL0791]